MPKHMKLDSTKKKYSSKPTGGAKIKMGGMAGKAQSAIAKRKAMLDKI